MPTKIYPSQKNGEQLFLRKLSEELDKKNDLYKLRNLLSDDRLSQIINICGKKARTGRPKHDDLIMIKLFIIQAMYGYTDSKAAELFQQNMYYQYFCGFEVLDANYKLSESCIRRFSQKLGEDGMNALMEYAIQIALANNMIKKKTFKKL